MLFEFLSFGFLALILGLKHSFDADHLIAVSTILRKPRTLFSAMRIGASWAIGHMATATIITFLLFFFRESLLGDVLVHFEKIAGVMLVALGLWSLLDAMQFHRHAHGHGESNHSHWHLHLKKNVHAVWQEHRHEHRHMLGIGVIHGLAGNDELLLLFTASLGITSIGGILFGVGVFSVGVVLGMVAFSAAFSLPQIRMQSQKFYFWLSVSVGLLSAGYGAASLAGIS